MRHGEAGLIMGLLSMAVASVEPGPAGDGFQSFCPTEAMAMEREREREREWEWEGRWVIGVVGVAGHQPGAGRLYQYWRNKATTGGLRW